MNNLTLRIITAVIGVAIIIGSIFIHPIAFTAVFMLIGILTHYEYSRTISNTTNKRSAITIYLPIVFGIFIMLSLHPEFASCRNILLPLGILFVPALMIVELYQDRQFPFQQIGMQIMGILYIPFAFALYIACSIGLADGEWFALGVLFMVWCNDTFAYFAGRWMGKHKLFERISPKKTWEGFIGGLVMSVVCGIVFYRLYPDAAFNVLYPGAEMTLFDWMGMGVVISVAGTFGDLAESMLKRSIDIKDSGSILPGHGGFLDRFDGFLLAVPCVVVYLYFVG